jgi:hypothetical protein
MKKPESEDFNWGNYLPQHRGTIALRFEESKRLRRCSLCGAKRLALRKALVHENLKHVGAEALNPTQWVKALALCQTHAALSNDALAALVWPDVWTPLTRP